MFFQGVGYNRLAYDDSLLFYCSSIHDRDDICKRLSYQVKKSEGFLQIDWKYIVARYDPISLGKGKLTMAMDMDVKVDFVPMILLKMVCKKFCKDLVRKVREIS